MAEHNLSAETEEVPWFTWYICILFRRVSRGNVIPLEIAPAKNPHIPSINGMLSLYLADNSLASEYAQNIRPVVEATERAVGLKPAKYPRIPCFSHISTTVDDKDRNFLSELAASRVLSKSKGYVKKVLVRPAPDPTTNE